MLGIILGAYTIKYAGVSQINWIYKKPKTLKNICGPEENILQRTLSKFSPEVLLKYDWAMFSSLKRYLQVIFFIFFVLAIDTLNFLLKFVLWIPAESDVCKSRVFIWAFTAIVCSKEYYVYIDDPNCRRVGPFFWLSTYNLFIEISIWFKFSRGMFDAPFPWYVIVIDTLAILLVVTGGVYAYINS